MIAGPRVLTAIVTYNSANWIEACLKSVLASDLDAHHLVVIDNASRDDTVRRIRAAYPKVEVIQNKRNVGFGQACNKALAAAVRIDSRYCFLLNPDTVLEGGCLRRLVEAADQHSEYFAVSPLQLQYDGHDLDPLFARSLNSCCDSARCLAGVVPVREIIGAAMLLRVECLRRVRGFDPLYFMYWEETDLLRRARYMSLKVGVVFGRTRSPLAPSSGRCEKWRLQLSAIPVELHIPS
jgi:GT2 family glycosyltransferase